MNGLKHIVLGPRVTLRGRTSSCLWVGLALWAFVLAFILSGCGDEAPQTTRGDGTTLGPQTTLSTGRPVSFTTEDGVTLAGHLFGSGSQGVVLAHMYPADQSSWFSTAARLAAEGYLVLTFDFRGYGESGGSRQIDVIDRDVLAAITTIREQGAGEVALLGASMGGTACLVAGDEAQELSSIRLAGIATLSAPVEFRGLSAADVVPRIVVPLLFIAAEGDAGASGARDLQSLSADKGRVEIMPGDDHGTDLLTGEHGEAVYALLRDFLTDCMPR